MQNDSTSGTPSFSSASTCWGTSCSGPADHSSHSMDPNAATPSPGISQQGRTIRNPPTRSSFTTSRFLSLSSSISLTNNNSDNNDAFRYDLRSLQCGHICLRRRIAVTTGRAPRVHRVDMHTYEQIFEWRTYVYESLTYSAEV